MVRGKATTSLNIELPRTLIDGLDIIMKSWRKFGFVGDRRDVIEALLAYSFWLHREEHEDVDLPPITLATKQFLHPFAQGREDLVFDITPYIKDHPDYDPAAWEIR